MKPKHKPLTAEEITGTTPLDVLTDDQLTTISREFQALGGKWSIECSGYTCWLRSTTNRERTHILPKGCTLEQAQDLAKQQRR